MSFDLEKHSTFKAKGPLFFVVMDGVGVGRADEGDAVAIARTPTLDMLDKRALKTTIFAHGTHVGLPSDADMGNSEVGHNAMGAGRIFSQGAKLVDESIRTGRFFDSPQWGEVVRRGSTKATVHLLGLLSDGNVHSNIKHVFAMIEAADKADVERLRIHVLLDGRDVGSTTALDYVRPTEALLQGISERADRDYRIASGGGRMFVTMDRYEADWSIVERGWQTHVLGQGRQFDSAEAAIETLRAETPGISDQVLPPFVIAEAGEAVGAVADGDAFIFFNFRGDRAIEITKAFEADDFPYFDRVRRPDVYYAGMMEYDGDLKVPKNYLVAPPAISRTMGEYLAHNGVKQLAISETQKFGHVTYFWNGNRSGYFDEAVEHYIEIPSDRVDFSERPWMKCAEITDAVITATNDKHYDFIRINYANGDMVGHTGHLEATVVAMEAVDLSLARLLKHIEAVGGHAIITADHGNADQMYQLDKKGGFSLDANGQRKPLTSHTLNKVPLWYYDPKNNGEVELAEVDEAGLSNLAATALNLLGYEAPADYRPSLLKHC